MKVAIIGAGAIAKAHLEAWGDCDRVEFVGAADVHPERAKALCRAYGGTPYTDYEKMLDELAPQAACVFTPPNVRVAPIKAAADRNIHVFCEKPVALSLAEADEIGRILGQTGITFAVGYVLRYFPLFDMVKETIASGKLGTVREFVLKRYSPFDCRDTWQIDPEVGGGLVLEFYTHDTDAMQWLLGRPTSVYGSVQTTWPGAAAPNHVSCIVTFESGATAVGMASWGTTIPDFDLVVVGDEGTLACSNWEELTWKRRGEAVFRMTQGELGASASPMREEMLAFLGRASGGDDQIADFEAGYKALALAASIMKSAENSEVIRL